VVYVTVRAQKAKVFIVARNSFPVITHFVILKHLQSSAFALMHVLQSTNSSGYRSSGIRKESPADAHQFQQKEMSMNHRDPDRSPTA
jgi:hypothetical protein